MTAQALFFNVFFFPKKTPNLMSLRKRSIAGLPIPIGNFKNLVPNFFDREKYVIHYENLQLYLRLGLKLQKKYIVY